jgi:hypothetical protein
VSKWGEITIRTPGMRATPDEMADFLRAVFPEDAIETYQRRIGEGVLREAVADFRRVSERKAATSGHPMARQTSEIVEMVLSALDPDDEGWNGYYPARLLCPHHDDGTARPAFHSMKPVMAPCPGYPRCKAGMEIRETRR